ncbi:putative leucine-rich repeat-containing, plant-type, leucine-rich repeat domain, L [Rosa chinensis]|uniref:Putative leucine-rich repeat-containing, plant-type, leucine-rich repeat domain, L n=1 Tax=Rosa chinensis TaxID=74649 RepID=A0A2P6QN81_ROSCH|nr:putative leucine-rich repeat-containing, plant-type, leucine-rich repeat domain, L [Rosa chinensis]
MLVQLYHQMTNAFIFFLLLIFSSNIIFENIHACNQSERSSLLFLALTLSSPQLNWTSADCCNWEGITCNRDGWVTYLQLPSKGLKLKGGIFPSSSLANLTHLTHLNLSHNSLSGSLDQTEFFLSLNDLEILDLSYNLLFGVLPSSLPSSHIRMVDLSSNRLHGTVPPSFFQQSWNLTSFNVSNNTFSGPIPSSICHPSSSSLRHLDFSFNKFNGSISSGLGKCSKLQISLLRNSLYGAVSDRISNLTNLTTLDLSYNQLSGVLPLHLGKLSKLKYILLDFNHLEGAFPLSLMNCTNLVELRMGANNLGGDISMLNFSKLSQLSKLDLRQNNFFGILPRSLYSCKFLKAIRVAYNNLEVQIEPEILSLKSLSFLSLSMNKRLTNIKEAMRILMGCKRLAVL